MDILIHSNIAHLLITLGWTALLPMANIIFMAPLFHAHARPRHCLFPHLALQLLGFLLGTVGWVLDMVVKTQEPLQNPGASIIDVDLGSVLHLVIGLVAVVLVVLHQLFLMLQYICCITVAAEGDEENQQLQQHGRLLRIGWAACRSFANVSISVVQLYMEVAFGTSGIERRIVLALATRLLLFFFELAVVYVRLQLYGKCFNNFRTNRDVRACLV